MFRVIVYKFIVAFVLISSSAFAQVDQEIIDSKPNYIKKAGKRSLKSGDYYGAIEYFKKYLESKPDRTDVKFLLAESYRMSRDYVQAEKTYKAVLKDDAEGFPIAYYFLGKMQIHLLNYDTAAMHLLKFKKNYQEKDKATYRKKVKLLLQTCETGPQLLKNKNSFKITHLDTSINKAHIELSPFLLNDSTLLYSSLRSDTIVYQDLNDTAKKLPVRKFYIAEKKDKKWLFKGEFQEELNNSSENGNATYNTDSTAFYFTRCALNTKGKMICAIHVSRLEDGEWQKAEKLPETINNPAYSSSQPTVGVSSKTGEEILYFVSDKPRSRGGKDIWYAEYKSKKKKFKKSKNAGSKINTVFDEMTPFYDKDNKILYFSSEGWPGIGGLDVFSTTGELKKWEVPANVGAPINSGTDELYYYITSSQDKGFFVSNRKGGVSLKNETCCDDIYEYEELKFIHVAIKGNIYDIYSDVNNSDSSVVLKNAKLDLYAIQDSTNEKLLLRTVETNEKGEYFFKLKKGRNYVVQASHDETLADNFTFTTKGINTSDTLSKDYSLRHVNEKPIVVKNIYYEFDKSDLTSSSTATIDTTLLLILEKNPSIIIEIGAHTDSKGSDSYNETLSQDRAQSVVDYLIHKGIDENRLKAKGYGESQPIAPNTCEDGTDNEEGRAMNRRTEFKIIGKLKGVSEVIYER